MPPELAERRHRSGENAESSGESSPGRSSSRVSIGGLIPWNIGVANALPAGNRRSTKRNLMLGWVIAFLVVVALIAGALGSGVLAGTAFAAAKIMFVLALLAFFISAVVEVTRRGAP
jgi:uncharacterized membrane protein YtjA (UPF0391 family)